MFIAHLLAVGLPEGLDEIVPFLESYLNMTPMIDVKKQGYKIKEKSLPAEDTMAGSLLCRAHGKEYSYILGTEEESCLNKIHVTFCKS